MLFSRDPVLREKGAEYLNDTPYRLKVCPKAAEIYARYCLKNYKGEKLRAEIEKVLRISPSAQLLCDYGEIVYEMGNTREAESVFRIAHYMVPSLIEPRYRLFVLLINANRIEEAKKLAHNIIYGPLKIRNTKAIGMINSIKQWLKENEQ